MSATMRRIWNALTAPKSFILDESRREYLTRVVTLITGIASGGVMLIFLTGWLHGSLPIDSLLISTVISIILFSAWLFSTRGCWRLASYIPPSIIYITAIYGSFIGGAGAPAMILYVLATILAAVLIGQRGQWAFLAFSIAAYGGIGGAQYLGLITQVRYTATSFPNRIIIVIAVYLTLSALIWLLVKQYRRALTETRTAAAELEALAEELMETNINLESEIAERRRTRAALAESEGKYRMLAEASPEMIFLVDGEGIVRYLNGAAARMFMTNSEIIEGKNIAELFPPDLAGRHMKAVRRIMESGETITTEIYEKFPSGNCWIEACLSPVKDASGGIIGVLGLSQDITGRKQAEERIQDSLREKEVLLREIHHRVKNNFQIIISLLSLQARNINNEVMTKIFNDSMNRIRAMALVHESLYQSIDIAEIDFAAYIQTISEELFNNYTEIHRRPELVIDIEDIRLGVDQAIPCGLIVNELITNALKYAFPEGRDPGRISISMHLDKTGVVVLKVCDNGAGIPAGFDVANSPTLGLELVHLLSKQIKGNCTLEREECTAWTITFPSDRDRPHRP